MDSNHHQTTIHTLAGLTRGNGGGNQPNKQHPMQHPFHHTQQPLVNTNSQNHQLLQFHHSSSQQQQQQHPYSTLSTMQQQHHHLNHNQHPNQLQLLNGTSNGLASLFANQTLHRPTSSQNSASSQATTLANFHTPSNNNNNHHHHQQLHFGTNPNFQHQLLMNQSSSQNSSSSHNVGPNGQHQQQAGAYNVNSSDYSSSTYHVYDQILGDQIIDDLIVIKQERMKKKLEQEQRRKVILFSLAVILLVGLLMFLLFQLLKVTTASSNIPSQIVPNIYSTSVFPPVSMPRVEKDQNDNRPPWAPPSGSEDKYWHFVPPGPFGVRPMPSPSIVPNDPKISASQQPPVPSLGVTQPASSSTTSSPIVIMPSMVNNQLNARNPTLSTAASQQNPTQSPSNQQQQQHQKQAPVSASSTVTTATSDSNNSNLRGCHGKHCNPTSGCPNQCSGRGHCAKVTSTSVAGQQDNLWLLQHQTQQVEWRCQCPAGTTGDDCGTLTERQCDDGLDNDKDGLVDCADSECCSDIVCQNSTLCMKSPDPLDILMRKPPLPPTSSFFQRMHFLIEKFSSQIYSKLRDFNDSPSAGVRNVDRASVIRGRVTYQKQGVTGVRVSIVGQTNLGITLSRDGGYFDLMVNGGGVILIEFKREPFATFQKAVRVPWNEIVLIDQVELQLSSQQQQQAAAASSPIQPTNLEMPTCLAHNYQLMRPQVTTGSSLTKSSISKSPEYEQQEQQVVHQTSSGKLSAVIMRDSQSIQQSVSLPQSASSQLQANDSVSIVYISSKAREFMSTINIQLTPSQATSGKQQQQIVQELKQVHLKIVVEGVLFEQSFEPKLNLSFTYAWNRQNVYRQKSFGLSTAFVSVGYEYTDCKHVIWSNHHVRLAGHDLPISEIGAQWSLNIHHRYNYRDSILQRGDGQNFNLKLDRPLVVQAVMGDGYPRQPSCPFCDGATSPSEQKLLRPQALVSGPDGSLYVGDHNMIRRIEPASVSAVAQAAAAATTASASTSAGPTSGSSQAGSGASQNSAERAVRTVLEMNPNRVPDEYSLALNLAPAEAPQLHLVDASHRQVLLVREQRQASSSSQATDSIYETTQPSSGGPDDLLVPVVGTGEQCQPDDRLSCGDGQSAKEARLIEPRAAAFDLEGRMYIADGPNVRLVDLDQKIYTILGDYSSQHHHHHAHQRHLLPCTGEPVAMHKFRPRAPRDLAFNPADETLHILDENVVYRITQDKRVQVVAGRPAHCQAATTNMVVPSGGSGNQQRQRATEVSLQSARSIAFSATGELFIGEEDGTQQNARVLLVEPELGTISLYAGQLSEQQQQQHESTTTQLLLGSTKQRASNALGGQQAVRASEHKFNSVAALTVDQQGNLLVADKAQLRVVSIEPDLPQLNAVGEYEIQSPEQPNELLVFNRHGLQVATRELSPSGLSGPQFQLHLTQAASSSLHSKYTFAYNVNTSYGLLASVSYATGNKISIYRDAPHHNVKLIETAFGGQCKLDMARNGQVQSISTSGSPTSNSLAVSKFSMSYYEGSGLLKQTRDQMTGEQLEFSYDEFGRALSIQ